MTPIRSISVLFAVISFLIIPMIAFGLSGDVSDFRNADIEFPGVKTQQQPDISGKWNSSEGQVCRITQNGNKFSIALPGTNVKWEGTIKGDTLTVASTDMRAAYSQKGKITEYDATGRPIKIVWENGLTLFREGKTQQVTPIKGWCCKDGKVFQTTITACDQRGGAFFKTRQEAEAHCKDQQPSGEQGWCCLSGDVFPTSKSECEKYGGKFFPTREAAEKYCQEGQPGPEEKVWCCKDGKVFQTTISACEQRGGAFFKTRKEAEEFCREPQPGPVEHGWCCLDGQVFAVDEAECREKGGMFFPNRQEAEEFCREDHQNIVWCCLPDGNVAELPELECIQHGGRPFPDRRMAEEHCKSEHPGPGPEHEDGWCCHEGNVFPANEEECRKIGGRFFPDRRAAEEFCREGGPGPDEGWCCLDGHVFPSTIQECRERGGRFFPTREEAEHHCQEEGPGPGPERGWCCLDGRIYPATEECCRELGGRFFERLDEAEKHCDREEPGPEPEQGWCCLDGRVVPSSVEACEHRGGHFFLDRGEAEKFCEGEQPPPEQGWCCLDGKVYQTSREACEQRGGRFFPTRERAEEFCESPEPGPGPEPEDGWCCLNGEIFPSSRAACMEKGGRFFNCREDAMRYCKEAPAPRPVREYLPLPSANMEVEDRVPLTTLEKIADAQAHDVWGENIARGHPFPLADENGDLYAYVFPYAIGSNRFPDFKEIFDVVRGSVSRRSVPRAGADKFGSVYVSARSTDFPILRTMHSLHPYFLAGEMAQERAAKLNGQEDLRLGKIYYLGPQQEFFEFVSEEGRILLDVHELEKVTPSEALSRVAAAPVEPEVTRQIQSAWKRLSEPAPDLIDSEETAITHTEKKIPHWELIPIVDWTNWCVPTAKSMVLGFWDNYVPGKGTIGGFGRLIDYWFDHPSNGKNVPNLIDEVAGLDPWKINNYTCTWTEHPASASNDWSWNILKREIDAGRPCFWSYPGNPGHTMCAFGYRINSTGKYAIVYNTWGTTAAQQLDEYIWTRCSGVGAVTPHGGTNGDHLVITAPDGLEKIDGKIPYKVVWHVWGDKIKKTTISFSSDGGRNWTNVAKGVSTTKGWNSYQWVPNKDTRKGRIKIQGYTDRDVLIASDGSWKNFSVTTTTSSKWGNWKSLSKPLTGNYGVERIAVGQHKDGRLEVVGIGSDGALWHRYQKQVNTDSWSKWSSMGKPSGNVLLRTVDLERNLDGRLEIVAIADDGALWHRYQQKANADLWIGWGTMKKPSGVVELISTPVLAVNKDGRLEVFVMDNSGVLWHRFQPKPSQGPWSKWKSLGKPGGKKRFYGNPVVGQHKDGRLQIFAMAGKPGTGEFELTKTAIWSSHQPKPNHKGSWSQWTRMGTPASTNMPYPSVGRNQDGRLEIYAPAADGALWHRYQYQPNFGQWSGWRSLGVPPQGAKLLSQTATEQNKDGRIEVFAFAISGMGPSSTIVPVHVWQLVPNGQWSKWGGLGTPPGKSFQSIAVAKNQNGKLEVFAIAAGDKSLWHIRQQ